MSAVALIPTAPTGVPTLTAPQPVVPETGPQTPTPTMYPDTMTPGAANGPLELYRDVGHPTAVPADSREMALAGGPVARRDGHVAELTRYQQDGKVHVAGDTVTQQIGRGHTAEYSLSQLAAHSKDPEYFANTMRYAAEHGDSVKIDVHNGVARVADPTLEHRLPQNMPLRDPILHAAVKHDVDPVLLAAVGVQETHLGSDYIGRSIGYNKSTHRGDVELDSPGGHGYGPFQLDDRSHSPAELARAAKDPYFAADKAAATLSDNLKSTGGNAANALHVYNSGKLSIPSSTTDWGPLGNLSYQESTMRYYKDIETTAAHEQSRSRPR